MKSVPSRHIHVAGVAGVGMSALAQVLTWTTARVTGSDRYFDRGEDLPVFKSLEASGIELVRQDGRVVSSETDAVVYSTAIEAENPDLAAASRLGVPLRHRAAMLAELARDHVVLAIAGTAGKTTTTAMIGWVLEQAGMDPTVVNGGSLVDWADASHVGNVRRGGRDAPWVVEVDESDRSLLHFFPQWSVLTNISQDHFPLEDVQALFREYALQVKRGIICSAGVSSVLGTPSADLVELDAVPLRGRDGYDLPWRNDILRVPQPGRHNAFNALMAAELCFRLDVEPAVVREALARFGGVQRRLERVDSGGPVQVVDDYAHNPAKIAAAWEAVAFPENRVLGIWRPHGYAPLRSMMEGLTDAFASVCRPQDHLWILPVYDAGGTACRSIQSDELVARLRQRGVKAEWVRDYAAAGDAVAREMKKVDRVLVMGARDPRLPVFARELASAASAVRN
ncbi:MAG: Mur ligase domain-containing protein [Verrucomicrobiota bacterium]|jgi:UDP-N-acetylmuramate--alanine ligase|nr:Mur ligase domain-containing protein [Verrucomicrobiota bacterium]